MRGLLKGAGLAVVALALAAGSADAQVKFGLGGGVTFPSGDALEGVNTGFHGTALLRISPPAMPIAFQIDGSYHRFGSDVDDLGFQVIDITGNVVYQFASAPATPVKPYLIGGVGYYSSKPTGDAAPDVDSSNDFGINLGAGMDLGKNFFAEARFHRIFSDPDNASIIPITVGFRF